MSLAQNLHLFLNSKSVGANSIDTCHKAYVPTKNELKVP